MSCAIGARFPKFICRNESFTLRILIKPAC